MKGGGRDSGRDVSLTYTPGGENKMSTIESLPYSVLFNGQLYIHTRGGQKSHCSIQFYYPVLHSISLLLMCYCRIAAVNMKGTTNGVEARRLSKQALPVVYGSYTMAHKYTKYCTKGQSLVYG